MTQKNDSQNFWSGYALGMLAGSVLTYAFGTKGGREMVKKVLNHTDTLEHSIEDILGHIQNNLRSSEKEDTKPSEK